MKRKILPFIIILSFFKPALCLSAEYEKYLPKWLELLEKGDVRERKLALRNLWFLEYYQYRQDPKVWEPILNTLKDKDPFVREAAAELLKRIGEEIQKDVDGGTWSSGCCIKTNIVPFLITALDDENPRVRAEAAKALGMYRADRKDRYTLDREERAIEPLIKSLQDKDPWVRLNAVYSLGELRANKAIKHLLDLLDDNSNWRNKFVQQEIVIALRKVMGWGTGNGFYESMSALVKKADDIYIRKEIIKTFVEFHTPEVKEIILKAADDPNEKIRKSAIEALSRFLIVSNKDKDQRVEIFIKSAKDPSPRIRAISIHALGKLRDNRAVETLIAAIHDADNEVQRKTIEAISNFNDEIIFITLADYIAANGNGIDFAAEQFQRMLTWTSTQRIDKKVYTNWINKSAASALLGAFDNANNNSKPKILKLMGQLEDERVIALFNKLLNDPSPEIRKLAADSLERISVKDLYPVLLSRLDDENPSVREQAIIGLGEFRDRKIIEPLLKMLKDSEPRVKKQSIIILGRFKDKNLIEPFLEMLNDDDDSVREMALMQLGWINDPRASNANIMMLRDESFNVKNLAITNIRRSPDKKAVEPLIELLNDHDGGIAAWAADALGVIGDTRAVEPLIDALKGKYNKNRGIAGNRPGDLYLRHHAAEALGVLKDKKAVSTLIEIVSSQNEDVHLRSYAAAALGEIGDPSALEPLKKVVGSGKIGDNMIYMPYVERAIKKLTVGEKSK